MKHITSISEIAASYDGFIIDLWGVMHDGTALYPGAVDALRYLHAEGKKAVFLSNAPRKAAKAQVVLDRLGGDRAHYHSVITSGQVAYDWLASESSHGPRSYYLGPGKDEDVLNGLEGYEQTDDPAKADFVLNAGFEVDFQPEAEIEPTLSKLRNIQLPLICINPDMEVVKQDGTRMLCAGWVAGRYEALGGTVHYIGKPHRAVYDTAFAALSGCNSLLAIGDNLLTDIKGANAVGIDSLLITGGILKSEAGHAPTEAELALSIEETGATPTYIADLFAA